MMVKHYHAMREEYLLGSENKNCIKTKGNKQKGVQPTKEKQKELVRMCKAFQLSP